jgi:hypothetical protein
MFRQPPPLQVLEHVAPASQVIAQPPPEQVPAHVAPWAHESVQPPPLQVMLQLAPCGQANWQPPLLQVRSQLDPAAQPSPAGAGAPDGGPLAGTAIGRVGGGAEATTHATNAIERPASTILMHRT